MANKESVMVIGAGGSLGSHLCGYLLEKGHRVIAVDISENKLCYLSRLYGTPIFMQDLQETEGILRIIAENNIHIIINCAAMKHVASCERYIERAIQINVIANIRLMEALKSLGKQFLYISSDKAIKPKNVYALTKHFADYVVLKLGFRLIRGVNFLYSNGSVLDIWERERLGSKSFTLVDSNCVRYFISLQYMCELVYRAMNHDGDQQIFFPSKVYGIKIGDLFKAYLLFSGLKSDSVEVSPIALSDWEKKTEDLDFGTEIVNVDDINEICRILESVIQR